ncbi:hypothetical protein EMIT079MI2_450004 [Bacillus sp. IT-79MI2]
MTKYSLKTKTVVVQAYLDNVESFQVTAHTPNMNALILKNG